MVARTRYGCGRGAAPVFPCRVPIVLLRQLEDASDEYGNPTSRWAREHILVFGVHTGGSDEVATATHPDATRCDLTVYAPSSAGIDDRDRFEWKGIVYEVDGAPANWDMNPFWSPGLVQANCNKVVG